MGGGDLKEERNLVGKLVSKREDQIALLWGEIGTRVELHEAINPTTTGLPQENHNRTNKTQLIVAPQKEEATKGTRGTIRCIQQQQLQHSTVVYHNSGVAASEGSDDLVVGGHGALEPRVPQHGVDFDTVLVVLVEDG